MKLKRHSIGLATIGMVMASACLAQTATAPDAEAKPLVRVYGAIEGHAIYDFKRAGPSDRFTDLASQPLSSSFGPEGRGQSTLETSRLGLEGNASLFGAPLTAKFEIDFYAYRDPDRYQPRIRHAYVETGGWLVGKTWSTFMDLDNLPETVDFNGAVGAPFSRRTMLRYSFGDDKAGYKLTFALEDPRDQFDGGSANENMPQLVARVDKSFDWGALNARALAHEKRSSTENRLGYGVAVGGRYKLSAKDVLMGQYTWVDGDIDQLYGANGYSIDGATGRIAFDQNQGVVLGYARTFSDQLRGNAVVGFNRGRTAQLFDNRTLRQVFVNLIYSPVKNLELGGELIYGERHTFANEIGSMFRADLMVRYSF